MPQCGVYDGGRPPEEEQERDREKETCRSRSGGVVTLKR